MTRSYDIILIVGCLATLSVAQEPLDERPQIWVRQDEPALSARGDDVPAWRRVVTYSPHVIHHDGKFRMWFAGTGTATRQADTKLGYAESTDGITWKTHAANPILTGDEIPWGVLVQTPFVMWDREDAIYKMWFVSGKIRKRDDRGRVTEINQQLGYATSADGLAWSVRPEPIYWSGRSPSIIKEGPNRYRMWMGSLPTEDAEFGELYRNIYEFESADGIQWRRAPKPAIRPSGEIRSCVYPYVIKRRDGFFIWYGGHVDGGRFQLYGAASRDGSAWSVDHDRAAFTSRDGKTAFDSRYVSTPCVLELENRYLIYYSARDWITEYIDGEGKTRRDGASPYSHIGVAELPKP